MKNLTQIASKKNGNHKINDNRVDEGLGCGSEDKEIEDDLEEKSFAKCVMEYRDEIQKIKEKEAKYVNESDKIIEDEKENNDFNLALIGNTLEFNFDSCIPYHDKASSHNAISQQRKTSCYTCFKIIHYTEEQNNTLDFHVYSIILDILQ